MTLFVGGPFLKSQCFTCFTILFMQLFVLDVYCVLKSRYIETDIHLNFQIRHLYIFYYIKSFYV